MQFPTLLVIAAMASSVIAMPANIVSRDAEVVKRDLHMEAYCIRENSTRDGTVNYDRATSRACAAYQKRNTGNKQWDKCPDCKYVDTLSFRSIPVCKSDGNHIGGDEFMHYCKMYGASDAVAS